MFCPSWHHSPRGYRFTSRYKNNRWKKVWCRIPPWVFSSGVGEAAGVWQMCCVCIHICCCFSLLTIPLLHWETGAVQAARLITEMPVTWRASRGVPRGSAWCLLAHRHTSQTRWQGSLISCDPRSAHIWCDGKTKLTPRQTHFSSVWQ